MIAVDTSALMAILLEESDASGCADALATSDRIVISAATVAEALIVAERRNLGAEMAEARRRTRPGDLASITLAAARRVADCYARWGKGMNSAGLNFGDCFAYEVAKSHDCPLLFVGEDFARTDVASVL